MRRREQEEAVAAARECRRLGLALATLTALQEAEVVLVLAGLPLTVDARRSVIATAEPEGDSRQVARHGADGGTRGLDHDVARDADTKRQRILGHQGRHARAPPAAGPEK